MKMLNTLASQHTKTPSSILSFSATVCGGKSIRQPLCFHQELLSTDAEMRQGKARQERSNPTVKETNYPASKNIALHKYVRSAGHRKSLQTNERSRIVDRRQRVLLSSNIIDLDLLMGHTKYLIMEFNYCSYFLFQISITLFPSIYFPHQNLNLSSALHLKYYFFDWTQNGPPFRLSCTIFLQTSS